MKKIAFVYSQMIIGGTTTALLSILNNIDYTKYQVDLILFFTGGEFFDKIPEFVNTIVLTKDTTVARRIEQRKHSISYVLQRCIATVKAKHYHNMLLINQYMASSFYKYFPKVDKHYDEAYSFIEYTPAYYVAFVLDADKKGTWIHLNYEEAGMRPRVEDELFSRLDEIYFVSESCLEGFKNVYPRFSERADYIENVFDATPIRRRAEEDLDSDIVKELEAVGDDTVIIVSSSRIVFEHKGYDRAITALGKLKHLPEAHNFKWFVIGDGADLLEMKKMVTENGLANDVCFLGSMVNPFPVIKRADLFLLPSRREGKPIAVTEALALGIPVLVARYSSADSQVTHGFDGIIVDNNDEAIYEGLKTILTEYGLLERLKRNAQSKDYSDFSLIQKMFS